MMKFCLPYIYLSFIISPYSESTILKQTFSLFIKLSSVLVLIMNLPPCVPGTYRFGQINTQYLSVPITPRSPKRENDNFLSDAFSTTLSEGLAEFIANLNDSTTSLSKPSAEGFGSSSDEDPSGSTTANLYVDSVELSKGQNRKNASVNPLSNREGMFPLLFITLYIVLLSFTSETSSSS